MATHPGDGGDWNLDSAASPRRTLKQRADTLPYVVSPEQMRCMAAEDAFVASVSDAFPTRKFTDRSRTPGR